MKTSRIIFGVASLIAVGILVYSVVRKNKAEEQLIEVADAGYETAHDVLYPLKKGKQRWSKRNG
ncbi:MAG TPA: hypothetical protein VEZ55_06430 [Chitinophagaceae bacterium]|jgi:predicted small secreted protein|nr:hypothetical protein [Chitinophagaceae bacterium]